VDDPPDRWRMLWPEQWSRERLLDMRAILQEHVFFRKYFTRVRLDASARFKDSWIALMLRLGQGRTFLDRAPKAQGGLRSLPCFTGVDLGIGEGKDDALTTVFTIAVDERGRCIVVDIQSGHWTGPEILDKLARVWLQFGSTIAVEDNAAQKFLVQFGNERFPVVGLHTGSNKHHEEFGVESIAVEMRNGWWVCPSGTDGQTLHEEARAWISEMQHYSPSAHTGDRIMASWKAREAARTLGGVLVRQIDVQAR
jgi:hypothetical protein